MKRLYIYIIIKTNDMRTTTLKAAKETLKNETMPRVIWTMCDKIENTISQKKDLINLECDRDFRLKQKPFCDVERTQNQISILLNIAYQLREKAEDFCAIKRGRRINPHA